LGSTVLHLAYVAKGTLIGTCTSSAKLWDIAAGALLVEQAGGTVTNLEGRSPFPIDIQTCNANPIPLLATSKKVHKQIREIFTEN
jgi:myo-inositol-1(or 4)-monophosphatase